MGECDGITGVLGKFFDKTDNIAILILVVLVAALLWLHILWRKEDRQDRKESWETVGKLNQTLTEIRVVLAGIGKSL